MKKLLTFAIALITTLSVMAQQKPVYERTRTNQVLSDYSTLSKYYMGVPTGAIASFPAYVPDSLKCNALFNIVAPGANPGIYRYDCASSTWKKLADQDNLPAVAVVNSVSELKDYSGTASTVFITDTLKGGLFQFVPDVTKNDNGIYFSATGKGSGTWIRQYDPANGINIEWYGAVANFDIRHSVHGTDSHNAITRALDAAMQSGGFVTVPVRNKAFGISAPLKLGLAAHIKGEGGSLFPYQTGAIYPLVDTLFYKPLACIYAYNGTDGITSQDSIVPYRNQGIIIKGVTVAGTGRNNGHTGITLKRNPNSTASANTNGLFHMEQVCVWGFETLFDGNNQADSHWIENSHFSNGKYGVIGGANELKFARNIIYDVDSVGVVSKGTGDYIIANEIQPGRNATGIKMTGTEGVSIGNRITPVRVGIYISGTRNSSTSDIITNTDSSAYKIVNAASPQLTSPQVNSSSLVSTAPSILVSGGSGFQLVGGLINKGAGTSTYGIQFVNSTNNYVSPSTIFNTYGTTNYFADAGTNTFATPFNINPEPVQLTSSVINTAPYKTYRVYGGSYQTPTAVVNAQVMGGIKAAGYTGSGVSGDRIKWRMESAGLWSTSSNPTRFIWSVTAPGSTSMTDRMALTSSGLRLSDTTRATAWLDATGSASQAPLRLRTSVAPTAPNAGDMWNLSGRLQFRDNASTNQSVAYLSDLSALVDNITAKSANYTIVAGDFAAGKKNALIVQADATTSAFNITLPSAASFTGYEIVVKKKDSGANAVTVVGTIDGATNYVLASANKYVSLYSDGTGWFIKANN